MSRLCRLKSKSHGEDGQWAYDEIISLRQQLTEAQAEIAEREADELELEQWLEAAKDWSIEIKHEGMADCELRLLTAIKQALKEKLDKK